MEVMMVVIMEVMMTDFNLLLHKYLSNLLTF